MRRFNGAINPKSEPVLLAIAEQYEQSQYKDHIIADTRSFYRTNGQKLGIGSSAAVAVGASVFLHQQRNNAALEKALDAHRKASDGIGSGVDLASVFRGVIATSHQPGPIEQLDAFFSDIHLAVFYLEKSASTKRWLPIVKRAKNGILLLRQ